MIIDVALRQMANRAIPYDPAAPLDATRARVDWLEARLRAARDELERIEAAHVPTALADMPLDILRIMADHLGRKATSALRLSCRRLATIFLHDRIRVTVDNWAVVTPHHLMEDAEVRVDVGALMPESLSRLAAFGDRPFRICRSGWTSRCKSPTLLKISTIYVDNHLTWRDLRGAFDGTAVRTLGIYGYNNLHGTPPPFPNLRRLTLGDRSSNLEITRRLQFEELTVTMTTFGRLLADLRFENTAFVVTDANKSKQYSFHPNCRGCRVRFIGLEPRHVARMIFEPRGFPSTYQATLDYIGDGWYSLDR